jgi:hypothetical protein
MLLLYYDESNKNNEVKKMGLKDILSCDQNWHRVEDEEALRTLSDEFEEVKGNGDRVYESSWGYFGKDNLATATPAILTLAIINADGSYFIEQRRECSPVGNVGPTLREVIGLRGGDIVMDISYAYVSKRIPIYEVDKSKKIPLTEEYVNGSKEYYRKRLSQLMDEFNDPEISSAFCQIIKR